jgi:hypothetical protein
VTIYHVSRLEVILPWHLNQRKPKHGSDNCPLWVAPYMTVCHYPFYGVMALETESQFSGIMVHPIFLACHIVSPRIYDIFSQKIRGGSRRARFHAPPNDIQIIISYTHYTTFYHHLPHPCLFCLCNDGRIEIFTGFGSGLCLLTGSRVSTHLVN